MTQSDMRQTTKRVLLQRPDEGFSEGSLGARPDASRERRYSGGIASFTRKSSALASFIILSALIKDSVIESIHIAIVGSKDHAFEEVVWRGDRFRNARIDEINECIAIQHNHAIQKGKERPPGSPDVDASPEHPEEDRRFSCRLFSQHHSSEGYRKGCRVIRRMPEATGGKLVEVDRLRWSPTQCNRLCGSGTRPGWDPSNRKRSRRRAWEPGLICDSAGDSEDARKGTGEAPDEVEGSRPETGKGLSQEPDDWSEE
ncbi:hypothetical protein B0H11DRAFT_2398673 [Mycena galericulata]|nr:hypothetical protein B0H11DRAFT_2398673 [Mycena galericulata]